MGVPHDGQVLEGPDVAPWSSIVISRSLSRALAAGQSTTGPLSSVIPGHFHRLPCVGHETSSTAGRASVAGERTVTGGAAPGWQVTLESPHGWPYAASGGVRKKV